MLCTDLGLDCGLEDKSQHRWLAFAQSHATQLDLTAMTHEASIAFRFRPAVQVSTEQYTRGCV